MKTFVNKPGASRVEFNKVPVAGEATSSCRTLHHYLQARLRDNPHDVDSFLKCPEGEDPNEWGYACMRQLLIDLNYYAYEHRDVSTAATEPKMEIIVNGQVISCLSAAQNPPQNVPAIDYITQTIDQTIVILLDPKTFPVPSITPTSRNYVATCCRRLYRIFIYSYTRHRDIFDRIEKETHICERFTKFVLQYSLMTPEDICIPAEAFQVHETE